MSNTVATLSLVNGALNSVYLQLLHNGVVDNNGNVLTNSDFNDYLVSLGLEPLEIYLKGFPSSYDHNGIYVHTSNNFASIEYNMQDNQVIANLCVELIVRDELGEKYLWLYQDALTDYLNTFIFGLGLVDFHALTYSKKAGDNGYYCAVEMSFITRVLVDSDTGSHTDY